MIGTDVVERQLRGCMLVERYSDAGDDGQGYGIMGLRGGNGTWHQTFMDDGGTLLTFDGRIVRGATVMDGVDTAPPARNGYTASRSCPRRTAVSELWRASVDGGSPLEDRVPRVLHAPRVARAGVCAPVHRHRV